MQGAGETAVSPLKMIVRAHLIETVPFKVGERIVDELQPRRGHRVVERVEDRKALTVQRAGRVHIRSEKPRKLDDAGVVRIVRIPLEYRPDALPQRSLNVVLPGEDLPRLRIDARHEGAQRMPGRVAHEPCVSIGSVHWPQPGLGVGFGDDPDAGLCSLERPPCDRRRFLCWNRTRIGGQKVGPVGGRDRAQEALRVEVGGDICAEDPDPIEDLAKTHCPGGRSGPIEDDLQSPLGPGVSEELGKLLQERSNRFRGNPRAQTRARSFQDQLHGARWLPLELPIRTEPGIHSRSVLEAGFQDGEPPGNEHAELGNLGQRPLLRPFERFQTGCHVL